MHPNRFFPLALLGLSILLPWTARAGDYLYPATGPVLTITLPDGWKAGPERPAEAGLTTITTAQDPNYVVILLSMAPHLTPEARNATLIRVAQNAAAATGLTDVSVSEVTEEKIAQSLRKFVLVHASGKLKGTDYTFVYGAFTLADGGPYYIIGETGPDASLLAHKEDFQNVANSIQPVLAGSPSPAPGLILAPPAPPMPPGTVATPAPSLP